MNDRHTILNEIDPEPKESVKLAIHYLAKEIVIRFGIEEATAIADRYAQIAQHMDAQHSNLGEGERIAADLIFYEIRVRRTIEGMRATPPAKLFQQDDAEQAGRLSA